LTHLLVHDAGRASTWALHDLGKEGYAPWQTCDSVKKNRQAADLNDDGRALSWALHGHKNKVKERPTSLLQKIDERPISIMMAELHLRLSIEFQIEYLAKSTAQDLLNVHRKYAQHKVT